MKKTKTDWAYVTRGVGLLALVYIAYFAYQVYDLRKQSTPADESYNETKVCGAFLIDLSAENVAVKELTCSSEDQSATVLYTDKTGSHSMVFHFTDVPSIYEVTAEFGSCNVSSPYGTSVSCTAGDGMVDIIVDRVPLVVDPNMGYPSDLPQVLRGLQLIHEFNRALVYDTVGTSEAPLWQVNLESSVISTNDVVSYGRLQVTWVYQSVSTYTATYQSDVCYDGLMLQRTDSFMKITSCTD